MMIPLIVEEIQKSGTRFLGTLRSERVVVGREVRDGIIVPYAGVSREHGEFLWDGTQWLFQDLGSTNGSWLNEEKVGARSPVPVKSGDLIQLGDALIRVSGVEDERHDAIISSMPDRMGSSGSTQTGFSRPIPKTQFGQILSESERNEIESTSELDRRVIEQLERQGFSSERAPLVELIGRTIEERIVFLLGFFLICGLISAIVFWFIK